MEKPRDEVVDLTCDAPVVVIEDHDNNTSNDIPLYQRSMAAPIGLFLANVTAAPPPAAGWHYRTSTATAGGLPTDDEEEVHLLHGDSYSCSHPPPWLSSLSSFPSLHEEVKAFAEFMSPTTEERRMREDVIRRVTGVILDVWPSAQVNVFGSSASDLFLPLSDVDMGVVGTAGRQPIFMLAAAFRKRGCFRDVEAIAKARVPIIKLVDSGSNCQVDISFGTANGALNTAIVKKFCTEAEEIRPLALVLKYYLRQLGLNEPYTGGIGSYTLLLMIISYIQLHRPEAPQGNDLGELLKGFLKLYGKYFNYHRTGISVRNGGFYYQKRARGWTHQEQPWLLSVEDPGDTDNDASKSSFGIMEVRAGFCHAHCALTSTSRLFESCPSLLSRILLRDRRLEHHRTTLRQLYAQPPAVPAAPADRKRTRDQRDHRLHHPAAVDGDKDDPYAHDHHYHGAADDRHNRYRGPRPRTHYRQDPSEDNSHHQQQPYRRPYHRGV